MKANQAFRKMDDRANISSNMVIGALVGIILVTSLVGLVADQVASAESNGNLSTTEVTLLGLLTLAFILVPVIAIFMTVGKRT